MVALHTLRHAWCTKLGLMFTREKMPLLPGLGTPESTRHADGIEIRLCYRTTPTCVFRVVLGQRYHDTWCEPLTIRVAS